MPISGRRRGRRGARRTQQRLAPRKAALSEEAKQAKREHKAAAARARRTALTDEARALQRRDWHTVDYALLLERTGVIL